jgi:hypothetical protein
MTKIEVGKTYKFRINSMENITEVITPQSPRDFSIFLLDLHGKNITMIKKNYIVARVYKIYQSNSLGFYDLTVDIINAYD